MMEAREAQQHIDRRARLGKPALSPAVMRYDLVGRQPTRPRPAAAAVVRPMKDYAPFDFLAPPGWRSIVRLVCLKQHVREHEILGRCRAVTTVAARKRAMVLVYGHCRLSQTETARLFNRDHSIMSHALRDANV